MSLNSTPSSDRIHIGIFGKRNAGKSTLINAITNQDLAIVSDVAGTTTDPVKKAMEILPLGPVVLIDTPGLDDEGELGELRVEKSLQALRTCDMAILVLESESVFLDRHNPNIEKLVEDVHAKKIPLIIVINKIDASLIVPDRNQVATILGVDVDKLFLVSADHKQGIEELKEGIAAAVPQNKEKPLVSDLIGPGDDIILVIPIDESAPKGRIILPQQQVLRDALEVGAIVHVCKDIEYEETLARVGNKNNLLVVTDSQAFGKISKLTPEDVRLTSFSILMARFKGDLDWQVQGARVLDTLLDGDKILISEGCTHHRQCNDIGTVKLPRWIGEHIDAKVEYAFTSGGQFPKDLSDYKLIIHCGACTLNPQEMEYRINHAKECGVPITNYGTAIAYMHGILDRCISVFE